MVSARKAPMRNSGIQLILETKTVVHNSTNSRVRVDQLTNHAADETGSRLDVSAAGGASVKLQRGLELGPFVVLCT